MEGKPAKENGEKKTFEQDPLIFTDKMLEADFDEVYRNYPLNEDTQCGIGFIKGKCLQM
jgi:hypothetical protein